MYFGLGSGVASSLHLYSNNAETFTLKGGNVGIGTITPNYKLHVGSSNNSVRIEGPATSGGVALSIGGFGDIQIDKPNLAGGRFIVKENGNIGIGTTTPTQLLDVNGSVKTISFQMTTGAGANKILQSDVAGIASWVNTPTPAHTIGESYGGGIVFYVYDNGQHGLIAATYDQSEGIQWNNGTSYPATSAIRDGIGAKGNTELIIAIQGFGHYAALLCSWYYGGYYGDWYLPSKYELDLLYSQRIVIGQFANSWYWSSSEYLPGYAYAQDFSNGDQSNYIKNANNYVRAIRAF